MTSERYGEDLIKELCLFLYNKKASDIRAIHVGDRTIIAEYLDYLLPLLQGEPALARESGLPRFAKLKLVSVK